MLEIMSMLRKFDPATISKVMAVAAKMQADVTDLHFAFLPSESAGREVLTVTATMTDGPVTIRAEFPSSARLQLGF